MFKSDETEPPNKSRTFNRDKTRPWRWQQQISRLLKRATMAEAVEQDWILSLAI